MMWTLALARKARDAAAQELARRRKARLLPKVERSFAFFLKHFVWIGDGGGAKFQPWPWQMDLARKLPGIRQLLVLKARQLGISWVAAAYAVWVVLVHRGALVLLVSQTEDDAVELLSKCTLIWDHLPDWMKPAPGTVRTNTRVLKLSDRRAAIVALPSTPRAGRGRTARLVIADEHAMHQWAAANFSALKPTVDAGGQFISISTANGVGNLFADLCARSTDNRPWVEPQKRGGTWRLMGALRRTRLGPSQWLPVFLPYDLRPGRDAAWWERELEAHPRPREFHQEYPRDPDEAFVQSGRPRFSKAYLDQHRRLCTAPLPADALPEALQGWPADELRVWELPKRGHRYVAGADVAEGLEHGDYSDLVVFDLDAEGGRPAEVLSLHGHWEPDVYAERIDVVARLYRGRYGVERNGHGLATVLALRKAGTPGLHYERPVVNKQGQEVEPGKPGWITSVISKPLMVDELERALRTFQVELRDSLAISELLVYQVLANGSTSAPEGQHDDRVMSRAIALQMVRLAPPKERLLPVGPEVGPVLTREWNL